MALLLGALPCVAQDVLRLRYSRSGIVTHEYSMDILELVKSVIR
jgi:hypothetical protein